MTKTSKSPWTILVLERSAAAYGSGRSLVEWMTYFQQQGGATFHGIMADDGPQADLLRALGPVSVVRLPGVLDVYGGQIYRYGILKKIQAGLAWLTWALKVLWKHGKTFAATDAIVVNNTRTLIYFLPVLIPFRLAGKPIVWRIQIATPLARAVRILGIWLSSLIGTTGGDPVAKKLFPGREWERVRSKHFEFINPLDPAEADAKIARRKEPLKRAAGDVIVTCVAMFTRRKRVHDLVDLAQRLRDFPGLRILHVGSATDAVAQEYQASVAAEIARLGLGSRIELLGRREDVVDILCQSDIFVLPSDQEGVPFAICEAMACSLPVIATRVGGVPAMVAEGRNALLYEPGDAVTLAAHVRALAQDPDRRRAMGKDARAFLVATGGPEAHHRDFLKRLMALSGRAAQGSVLIPS